MNLTNFHTHTTFSDGHATMEDFVRGAIELGFSSLGFTSHAPFPYKTRWTMDVENRDAYVAEFERLKEKYKGQIELYLGLEIDYLNESHNQTTWPTKDMPLDFRIGSIHTVIDDEGQVQEIDCKLEQFRDILYNRFGGDVRKICECYWRRMMRMVELGNLDIIGHPGKMVSHLAVEIDGEVLNYDWHKKLEADFYDLVAQKGYFVEMNTKLFDTRGRFFPRGEIYPFLRDKKIKIVVNSDAHFPEKINAGRVAGLQYLRGCGYKTVMEMHGGKWEEAEILV